METENQILRKQSLVSSSSQRMSRKFTPATAPPLENGHQAPVSTPAKTFGSEVRRSQMEKHHESVDALFNCVAKDLGFSEGKPVAAFTIYNCLLHWRFFEAENTNIFDRLIQLIGSAIVDQDNYDSMAYWLSNTSALFSHLHQCLKVPSQSSGKPPTPNPNPTMLISKITRSFRSSSNSLSSNAMDVENLVEAKFPALIFKQQLAAYVETIYGIIRENLKKELSPLLSSCIQAHRKPSDNGHPAGSWFSIIGCLNKFLKILKENHVPPVLVQKIFNQIFQYIKLSIWNCLIAFFYIEKTAFTNGEHVESGLAELELWCSDATEEYAGSSLDELKHARQAVRFLVTQEKDGLLYDDLTNELCPVLSSNQLYRICTLYWDVNDNTQNVSSDVTTRLKLLMTDGVEDDDKLSFLLEDNSDHPINVEEFPKTRLDKTAAKVTPPAGLLEKGPFQFLHDYC